MKKHILLLILLFSSYPLFAHADDLMQIYQQAQISDPVFQQALAQRSMTQDNVPISLSSLLPQISLNANPSITIARTTSNSSQMDAKTTTRAYHVSLRANQTLFNVAKFANLASTQSLSKKAEAILNVAVQDLMIRVTQAYFAILQDEENLKYSQASTHAYQAQLKQVKQEYTVGLKTITDVYTAQAAYDSALAIEISMKNRLAIDYEKLRIITGKQYHHLAALSKQFPLEKPDPEDINRWTEQALAQNWSIKAAQYAVSAAKQQVKENVAGHLPTLDMQASLDRSYANNYGRLSSTGTGSSRYNEFDKQIALQLNVPLFSGGQVSAKTHQASAALKLAEQQLEEQIRNTESLTRQHYLNIIAGLSQIHADQQTIKSTQSALDGMMAQYQAGTETLVNVLNQRENLFRAQTQYATDRYAFITNLLALKQATGTLSFFDLQAINHWLQ